MEKALHLLIIHMVEDQLLSVFTCMRPNPAPSRSPKAGVTALAHDHALSFFINHPLYLLRFSSGLYVMLVDRPTNDLEDLLTIWLAEDVLHGLVHYSESVSLFPHASDQILPLWMASASLSGISMLNSYRTVSGTPEAFPIVPNLPPQWP